MGMQQIIVDDPAAQARQIQPSDFMVAFKVAGAPGDAVAMDTAQAFLETSLRAVLRAIIQTDAPGAIRITDFHLVNDTTIRLEYTILGHTAHLDVDLSTLHPSVAPALIGLVSLAGIDASFAHGDHGHRLPSRANAGETPIIELDHLAAVTGTAMGMFVRYNPTTGIPEAAATPSGVQLSTDDPEPVGGPNAPATGDAPDTLPANHQHGLAARSVGLAELEGSTDPANFGQVYGLDGTGTPVFLAAGQSTFEALTDTPTLLGTEGQAAVVNAARDALVFDGPFQPLVAPPHPDNLRVVDAFDGSLEMAWDAVSSATAYQWQRKPRATANWPTTAPTQTTGLSVRSSPIANVAYDFRVRAVGHGGHLTSAWTEILNIPVIPTPTPAAAVTHQLSRVRSQTLRFSWDDLDVNNGGVGDARVVKQARYEYEYREGGTTTWGAAVDVPSATNHEITGLTNGTLYEARVRGHVRRSDGTMTDVAGPWSGVSNREKPVKTTVTLTYGVAATRTGAITSPRSIELTPGAGSEIEITNAANPATNGQFYVLDVDRGDEYDRDYDIVTLETRPLPSDITAGADFQAEAQTSTGARRYSIGPSRAITAVQRWWVVVN